jgi:hypothetical protein
MPLPLLAMLALQAAGTGASLLAANKAKKRNEEAMNAAAGRASAFQPKELGKTLKGQYFESLLSDKDLSESQKQEAQDLLRSQANTDYGISDYAPSGFAALGAQAAGTAKTQDALGRLGSKYAPMSLAAKQRTDQLAQGVEQSDYLNEQARRDKEQTLINLGLGRAMAENQNRNQMTQLGIGLASSMAGTLAGASKEDLNKLFGLGKTTQNTTQNFIPTQFTSTSGLPKVDPTKLYNNAMKPQYNVNGIMTKRLNPLQAFATKNLSGSNGSDFTQGVQFNGKPLFNQNQNQEYIGDTEYLSSVPINHGYGADNPNVGAKFGPSNPYAPQPITPHYNKSDENSSRFYTIPKNPWEAFQNPVLANAYNANMYYKPKGKYDVQLPIGYENFINDRNYR